MNTYRADSRNISEKHGKERNCRRHEGKDRLLFVVGGNKQGVMGWGLI